MFSFKKKVLFGLSVSLVLAMAIGSFAIGETQTPANPQVQTTSDALTNDATCDFVVSGDASEYAFSYSDEDGGVLTITGGEHTISMAEGVERTAQRIEINGAATITLNNVDIEADYGAAVKIKDNADFDVSIMLANGSVNTLKGKAGDEETDESGAPGIEKSNDTDVDAKNLGTLTIGSINGPKKAGILNVCGGYYAAGIGSVPIYDAVADEYILKNTNNITITGGEINTIGGNSGAGIGGGSGGEGSKINIEGGTVIAEGGITGAGIGGGFCGNGSYITIKSGVVVAKGNSGAGIGGGYAEASGTGNGSHITIEGGEVEAYGAYGGAGIGSGGGRRLTGGSDIKITGGKVKAVGDSGGAGIGGGFGGDGNNIEVSGGVVTAIGGFNEDEYADKYPGAGIGGGCSLGQGGEASGNKLSGNAVVFAASGGEYKDGKKKEALQGFDSASQGSITGGIAFTGVGIYEYIPNPDDPEDGTWKLKGVNWDESGRMYGDVTLSQDVEIPAKLTISDGRILSIEGGKKVKISGAKLIVEGELRNNGMLTLQNELEVKNNGKIETLLNYDPQGGAIKTNDGSYITYKNASGVQTYGTMPSAEKDGLYFGGWYTEEKGEGTKVNETSNVLLNQHTLYANWTTDPGPEPTPTPPGPEPGPEPTPTPDPSVDPDGGDGSGSGASSKTSDPFMGGIALALLGVATTGAVLVRKRK